MMKIFLFIAFFVTACNKTDAPKTEEKVDNAATRYADTLHGSVTSAENAAEKANKKISEYNQTITSVE